MHTFPSKLDSLMWSKKCEREKKDRQRQTDRGEREKVREIETETD